MLATTMMSGFGWLGMGFMWLWMLVPVALLIGAVWLVATATGRRDRPPRGDDAAAVLQRRLAAGEIALEEYEKTRAALGLPDGRLEAHRSE